MKLSIAFCALAAVFVNYLLSPQPTPFVLVPLVTLPLFAGISNSSKSAKKKAGADAASGVVPVAAQPVVVSLAAGVPLSSFIVGVFSSIIGGLLLVLLTAGLTEAAARL